MLIIDHKAGRERALAALSENRHRMARFCIKGLHLDLLHHIFLISRQYSPTRPGMHRAMPGEKAKTDRAVQPRQM